MVNIVYLESFTNPKHSNTGTLQIPLESFITYCVFKYCSPEEISINFVIKENVLKQTSVKLHMGDNVTFVCTSEIPWQVNSCVYPVVMCEDMIITGICGVARHICKYRTTPQSPYEHEEGLLGFRKSCLQAPNEVSIWTKFCEVDVIKTIGQLMNNNMIVEVPKNLVRFENHLKKPVRVHNVYKMARDIKKLNLEKTNDNPKESNLKSESVLENINKKPREPKTRKWKSNTKKEIQIDCSIKIKDLNINHQFAEGPFLTLADLLLLPSYYILLQSLGENVFKSHLPLTNIWFNNLLQLPEMEALRAILFQLEERHCEIKDITVPHTEDVSLYKCDPKRHNPKKRLFTKEEDIENALNALRDGMELNVSINKFELGMNWNEIPNGANPAAGHLPDDRMERKSQQLENLALAVMSITKEGDLIVDFCCGSGHLGILLAYLLPKCTIILLENKEQSLLRARDRVHKMGLKNVYFFQCNLDFFDGKFDIGIGLHACGIASDLVLDKCLKANAKFVLCPCCYGSLHATDRLVYPRSKRFEALTVEQYLCIGHAADQTYEEHPLTVRGAKCMAVIDSDRARLAEEFGYKVTLSRLKPLNCTPKNNLLIGTPLLK